MEKIIFHLKKLTAILEKEREGKTVGLITGCFDIFHPGHRELFDFAKRNVDILIVGIDTDDAVRKTKGKQRPINRQIDRAKQLEYYHAIDYILLLKNRNSFERDRSNKYYDSVVKILNPTHLITTVESDVYTENKRKRIESIGGELLIYNRQNDISTSKILKNGHA